MNSKRVFLYLLIASILLQWIYSVAHHSSGSYFCEAWFRSIHDRFSCDFISPTFLFLFIVFILSFCRTRWEYAAGTMFIWFCYSCGMLIFLKSSPFYSATTDCRCEREVSFNPFVGMLSVHLQELAVFLFWILVTTFFVKKIKLIVCNKFIFKCDSR
jgi:hypothetical protein